jgi:hypothetical protein
VSEPFETVVERLRELRSVDDASRWTAGDVVVAYVGQVEHSEIGDTLNALAAHSGYTRAGLRERYDCSKYWRPETRRWNTFATWSHYNRARRGFEFEDACDLLEVAEKSAMSVAAFEQHCQMVKGNRPPEPAPPADPCADLRAAVVRYLAAMDAVRSHYEGPTWDDMIVGHASWIEQDAAEAALRGAVASVGRGESR